MDKQKNNEPHPFLKFLFSLSPEKDRGVFADLRRGFSKTTEMRSWSYIGRFCNLNNDEERIVYQTIAAGFATNPEIDNTPYENWGSTMRKLAKEGSDENKTFDVYFRRILACNSVEDVCERLRAPIIASKSKSVSVPWESLFWDLLRWNERAEEIKTRWAANYWGVPRDCDPVSIDQESEEEESLQ